MPPLPFTPILFHLFLSLLVATGQVLAMSMIAKPQPVPQIVVPDPTTLGIRKLAADPLQLLALDAATPPPTGDNGSEGPESSPDTIWTILGSRDAPHRMAVILCPTCPQCADLHEVLHELAARYPQQLRIDVRFWPLWHSCNDAIEEDSVSDRHRDACEIVRHALAVAAVDSQAFAGYLDWLFGQASPATAATAETEARARVDGQAFSGKRDAPALWKRFDRDVELANQLGVTSVPRLFLSEGQVYGSVTVGNLEELLARLHGFQPAASKRVEGAPVWVSEDYLLEKAKTSKELIARGEYALAARNYREMLKVKNDWPDIAVRLAWLLATCPDEKVRDGQEAVRFAKRAERLIYEARDNPDVQRFRPDMLDALAAAYAEVGEFERAQDTAKIGIDAYQHAGRMEEAAEIHERWEIYQRDEPYRERRQ
ncbi:MAG: thioredoxin domain-containing protein [Planctomycetales bacterium]|nr:thioredoxin domain-containing protein [Planctomycetales bacterium]NIN07756.1 thioredoxin domain-containing protein [Planctomycetales bacterium]NIP03934.1 thioredoxin domain-containing protein [Planctomycetales bacterium]